MNRREFWFVLGGLVFGMFVTTIFYKQISIYVPASNYGDLRDFVLIWSVIFGGPLLVWRSASAAKAAEAATDNARAIARGNTVERFSRAIDQIAAPADKQLSVRIGGIYTLESVARDWPDLHWSVIEILASFVRLETPVLLETSELEEQMRADDKNIKGVIARRADIQAALNVLGRRDVSAETKEHIVDLNLTYLFGAILPRAKLHRVSFFRSVLCKADLTEAEFYRADIRKANLRDARLIGADLRGIAYTEKADLRGAKLDSANIEGVDFSKTLGLTEQQMENTISDEQTRFPWSSPDPELRKAIHLAHAAIEDGESTAKSLMRIAYEVQKFRPGLSNAHAINLYRKMLEEEREIMGT